jgi:RNA polymerase sigma factor (TIGR02999 family)
VRAIEREDLTASRRLVSCILACVSDAGNITVLLQRSRAGDHDALNELLPLVYDDLRSHAGRLFNGERRAITLQPTALVSEAYLRLLGHRKIQWNDRNHFFAVAARLMRQILVDYARARNADKRGGPHTHVTLGSADEEPAGDEEARVVEILNLDGLLDRLAARNARQAQVVELRVFAGLSVDETAETLNLSPRTIKTDWQLARAWLARELGT